MTDEPNEANAARGDVVVAAIETVADRADARRWLDAAEAAAGVPLVDEAERRRLDATAEGRQPRAAGWQAMLARRSGTAVGYAGIVLPTGRGGLAVGDVAVTSDRAAAAPVRSVLLAELAEWARRHAAGRLQVWLRHATAEDVAGAAADGYEVERRLGVLGRPLDDPGPVSPPHGVTVRGYRPDGDDEQVVEVLAGAYGGTDDGGWTLERFQERRGYDWFRAADLLVAEGADGRLQGLHWLKRRGGGVGEVYNLAIHPRAQGSGLGPVLLGAGLEHLAGIGCDEVLLWVDLANERAVGLYTSHGFVTRWQDVALSMTSTQGRVTPSHRYP
jgi:mycothiol synthase